MAQRVIYSGTTYYVDDDNTVRFGGDMTPVKAVVSAGEADRLTQAVLRKAGRVPA